MTAADAIRALWAHRCVHRPVSPPLTAAPQHLAGWWREAFGWECYELATEAGTLRYDLRRGDRGTPLGLTVRLTCGAAVGSYLADELLDAIRHLAEADQMPLFGTTG